MENNCQLQKYGVWRKGMSKELLFESDHTIDCERYIEWVARRNATYNLEFALLFNNVDLDFMDLFEQELAMFVIRRKKAEK